MAATGPTTLRRRGNPIARALNAIATATRHPFTMRTVQGRFRIQKTVYLLRHMGYPPAQRFDYNHYLIGPYSPDLSACSYALGDAGITAAGTARDIPPTTLDVLRDALGRSDSFLEGLTTLLDVYRVTHHLPAALVHAKAIKPHLRPATWREVRSFLAARRFLTSSHEWIHGRRSTDGRQPVEPTFVPRSYIAKTSPPHHVERGSSRGEKDEAERVGRVGRG